MVDVKKFSELDLYGLIGVEITANETEVSQKMNFTDKKSLIILFIFRSVKLIVKRL